MHVVVDVDIEPSAALRDFKAYASRRLREHEFDPERKKRWARSGNIARLSGARAVQDAVAYVIEHQGAADGLLSGCRLAGSRA